jgi:hypothetical protein
MTPDLLLQPVPIATGSNDEDGRLVLVGGQLVAVLVRLADPAHENLVGAWFLEAGFGRCKRARAPIFDDLDAAQVWIRGQLGN